jgi:hypothetical protein
MSYPFSRQHDKKTLKRTTAKSLLSDNSESSLCVIRPTTSDTFRYSPTFFSSNSDESTESIRKFDTIDDVVKTTITSPTRFGGLSVTTSTETPMLGISRMSGLVLHTDTPLIVCDRISKDSTMASTAPFEMETGLFSNLLSTKPISSKPKLKPIIKSSFHKY